MLNDMQINEVSQQLSNFYYHDNLQATKDLMELFDRILRIPPKTVYDYVKSYDDSFYTYKTFDDLVKSEKEQSDGFTEEECLEQVGISIWQLPCGWYVQAV